MGLFLGLYLGHVLGDFALQPGRLVVAKRRGAAGLALHAIIVTGITALVVAARLPEWWPAVVAAGLAHSVIELLTVRARNDTPTSGLTVFLLDQALHVTSLAVIAFLLAGPPAEARSVLFLWPVSTVVLAVIALMATVALFGGILVFEVETSFRRRDGIETHPILGLDGRRLFGIAERAVAFGLSLVGPGPYLGFAAFLPRLVTMRDAQSRRHDTPALAVGGGLVLVAWGLMQVLRVVVE